MPDRAADSAGERPIRALFLNCTLKRSPEPSHTDALIWASQQILESQGVEVASLRPVDRAVAPGVQPDMTKQGWERDEWPEIQSRVMASDILVVTTPIWLGAPASECVKAIERLYASSAETNDSGQYDYYGRVGGVLITGNEDGGKHCAKYVLYALQHLGFMIPPQADAYWVGEAGPGPSYRDDDSPGPDNEFTNRCLTFMTWNLLHAARLLRAAGGFPTGGNSIKNWKAGDRFGHPGPSRVRSLKHGPSERTSRPPS